MSKPLRIKQAIADYNANLPEGEKKMTQQRLADLVVDKSDPKYRGRLMSFWCNAHRDPSIEDIRRLCEVLKVDYNYLFK